MKAIPTGVYDYRELKQENYYSVDKTLMIKDFLERKSKVTLVTRPRRFGKTINMSMMSEFFDITKDSKEIFKGTKIMDTPYASELNQYPTIFISFADAKENKETNVEKKTSDNDSSVQRKSDNVLDSISKSKTKTALFIIVCIMSLVFLAYI